MAISIVAKTRAFATLQTNITLALPAGVQNGDVLVAVLTHQNNANVWTLPDGTWSRIGNTYVANDADYRGDIFAAHVVTNATTEPSTFTYTYAGGNGRVTGTLIAFRGVDTTAIDDGHPAAKALTTTGNVRTMPSFTVGHDNSYLLWMANNNLVSPNAAGVTLSGTDTQLDFLSSIGDTDNTTGTRTLLAVYGRQLGTAGASPTPSVTWPAVSGANIMAVALKAAGNASPTAAFTKSTPTYTNRVTMRYARNGTTSHTFNPSSATGATVTDGQLFTPTAGRFLVGIVEGAVTTTGTAGGGGGTAPTGWTLPANGAAVNNTGLYVFYKTAAGSDTMLGQHNGSNYTSVVTFIEYPAGTTFLKAAQTTGIDLSTAGPALTGLTGTNDLWGAVATGLSGTNMTYTSTSWTGTPVPTKVADAVEAYVTGQTDTYAFSAAQAQLSAVTSWTPNGNMAGAGLISKEALAFAVTPVTGASGSRLVYVTSTSTDSDGTIASYDWDWGDGTTHATTASAQHYYTSAGTFTIKLTVTDNGGATSFTTQTVTFAGGNTAPVANFSYSANDTVVTFTDTSTDSDGTIATRAWTFGDGTTSTVTNPAKTYAKAGTYSVSLQVTDNGGATNTKTQSITVTGVTAYIWNGTVYREAHLKKDLNGVATAVGSVTGEFGVRPDWNQVLAKTTPIYGAHRGFSGNYPEMTLRAYNAATILWKDKVDFLEVSVQFDSQGVAWGLHDSTVNRTAGGPTGALSTFTTAQVAAMNVYPSGTDNQTAPPAPMYKLTDMLARFGGKVPIILEDKTYTHTTQILDLMDANGGPNWYMWKQSGNGTLFPAVTARGYKSWGYYFDGSDMTVFPNNHTQWTFVGVDFNSSDATLTSAVATAGNWTDGRSRVIGHIVGNATQRDRMLGMGMRGLMVSSGRLVLPRF